MASKTSSSLAFFLVLNVLFFALVSATECTPPVPKPPVKPTPKPCPEPKVAGKCPIDTLKLGVCANVLNGLINVQLGTPPKTPCCTLIKGLADVEAALCLCTVIKANVLGLIKLNVDVSLSLLVNYCGRSVPAGFICP